MKSCPYCLEEVKDGASKCPHCQSSLLQSDLEGNARYVRYDIDKGTIRLGKFIVVAIGLLFFIGLAFYGFDLKNALEKAAEAKSAATLAELDAKKAQFDAHTAQVEAERSKSDAHTAQVEAERSRAAAEADANKTRADLAELNKQLDDTRPKLLAFNATMDKINNICNPPAGSGNTPIVADQCDSLPRMAENISSSQVKLEGLDKRVNDLERQKTESIKVLSSEVQDRLHNDIRVKEVAVPARTDSNSGRTYYDLTFSVCVQNGDQCDEKGLENVEKVSYNFDPRWFAPSVITNNMRDEAFAYHVQVWGRTKVTACIYLKGESAPVVRSEQMSFNRASGGALYWGPEASGSDPSREGCSSSS
jgi:hypothetical protein